MNDFVAKKLAEVQAFIDLATRINDKGGVPLAQDYPEVMQILQTIGGHVTLAAIVTDNLRPVFDAKVQKTVTKLSTMMELYIGNSWDDAVEILEWLSFYAGSASAHAALAAAALKKGGEEHADDVSQLSESFWQLLTDVRQNLADTGTRRA